MIAPLLAGLALYTLQSFLPMTFWWLHHEGDDAMAVGLGPRDQAVELPLYGQRAKRAHLNFAESLPAFIALTLLHQVQHPDIISTQVAWGFVAFRLAYVPAYISGIPGARSMMWAGSLVCLLGLALMLFA